VVEPGVNTDNLFMKAMVCAILLLIHVLYRYMYIAPLIVCLDFKSCLELLFDLHVSAVLFLIYYMYGGPSHLKGRLATGLSLQSFDPRATNCHLPAKHSSKTVSRQDRSPWSCFPDESP
jgi:hypothetical protein